MTQVTKKKPKILFIKNVFKMDCIEFNDSFENKILDEDDINKSNVDYKITSMPNISLMSSTTFSLNTDYQKNPKIFESLDMWPRGTNLHCWYCYNQFIGPPKFIPLVIEPSSFNKKNGKYLIVVEGNFCRWPCCKSYIKETTKDLTKFIEKYNNLCFVYYIWTGQYPKHIPDAPNKYLQKIFGGDYTSDQYYKLYNDIEQQILDHL